MRIPKQYKPELIESKDKDRTNLHHCELDTAKGRLYATDGYRLVSLPVDVDPGDSSGPIDGATLKEARKLATKDKRSGAYVGVGEKDLKLGDGRLTPRPDKDNRAFPNVDQVIPTENKQPIIAVNVKLLFELTQSIGQSDHVVALAFDPEDPHAGPIRIYATGNMSDRTAGGYIRMEDSDPLALLMPCKLQETWSANADAKERIANLERELARLREIPPENKARELFTTVRDALVELRDTLRAGDTGTRLIEARKACVDAKELACGIQREAIVLALESIEMHRAKLLAGPRVPEEIGPELELDAIENAISLFTVPETDGAA